MCHVDIIFIRIIVNLTINLACVHHVPLCVATRPIRCPGYVTPRHTTRITNDIQRPTRRNTMLITSATIKWPFPRNSSKHGTRSSMTRRTNSGIPKNKVQQTRLLHLAKGRKVSRKVICDAASPERELRQDGDDETMVHTRATHATRARVFLRLAMARSALR